MPRLLDYPGGKTTLAPWILSHIPRGVVDTYNEPYCGSAAVLLGNSMRFGMETLNDANGELINFFRVFRDYADELIRKIELTPWATDEYERCRQPSDDPIEAARRFYLVNWASIRPFDPNPSFRRQKVLSRRKDGTGAMTPAAVLFARTDHLWALAERLRGVTIENMDALEFVELYDYDRAFFYVDPPYPFHTRQNVNRPAYGVELVADGRDEDADYEAHKELADVLKGIDGYAIVSGYPCEWYATFYEAEGWRRVDKEARINGGKSTAIESLWISPRTGAALDAERLPLFAVGGEQ